MDGWIDGRGLRKRYVVPGKTIRLGMRPPTYLWRIRDSRCEIEKVKKKKNLSIELKLLYFFF